MVSFPFAEGREHLFQFAYHSTIYKMMKMGEETFRECRKGFSLCFDSSAFFFPQESS